MKKCVFAGTFDPPTAGHKTTVEKSLKIFDCVVVALMVNPEKKPFLSVDEREFLLKKMFAEDSRVTVRVFNDCAAVDVLERENTIFYVRGVRDGIDFEYENRNHFASKKLKDDMVTVYIPAEQEEIHVSSSLVRSCVRFKKEYLQYIPAAIREDVEKILENKRANGELNI